MTFVIDADNKITAYAGATAPEGAELKLSEHRFGSERELATLAGSWPGGRLIEIWNSLPGVTPVKKFTDRKKAVARIWKAWGDGVTEKLVWQVVKEFAASIGTGRLAPHDLRRTCARLCRAAGGELEQIQFLLGHLSVQTTERYLGCTQRIASAVNDKIGIEPTSLR